jgi:alkylation response protein AidB-like acyl-CoA dehydrogenase
MGAPAGASWLLTPVGTVEQFTGADFTEDDLLYARTAEDFVRGEVLPKLEALEAKEEGLMPALLKRAGELGLLMIDIPERYGGLGLSKTTSMLVSERGALCASFSVSWGAHTGIGSLPLVYYGTEAQKARYLPKLATGEWLAAYALTEPQAGSDALAAKTKAVLEPGGKNYRLTGTKQFITNAGFADLFTVFAKIDGEKFTAFLVERSTPGLSLGPEEHKLGIRGSSTRQLILEDAAVPADRVLGDIGRGHKIAFNILNIGRFKLGAGSVGAAKDCLQIALAYARDRHQHGRAIASFGMIQRKLADMATRIYVADSMSYRTAGLMDAAAAADHDAPDAGRRLVTEAVEEYTLECSILKVFGTETLDFVADEALQILGGYGFTADYPVERHYRDSRINRIFEGTNEINRLIIPATLVKRIAKGKLPYFEFLQQVDHEIADRSNWPPTVKGPLSREVRCAEVAKRVIAYTARLLMERSLDSLKDKQQHLELLANMLIDAYAMDSVVERTQRLVGRGTKEDGELRLAMTNVFVSSANERVIDGARRILVNEFEGEELKKHLALEAIVPHMPIRTIAVKTRISEALVARGLGPVFLR